MAEGSQADGNVNVNGNASLSLFSSLLGSYHQVTVVVMDLVWSAISITTVNSIHSSLAHFCRRQAKQEKNGKNPKILVLVSVCLCWLDRKP